MRRPTQFLPALTLPALALGLVALTPPAQAQEAAAARFLEVWDLNQDGTVTLPEMQRMRGNVFGRFDETGDGMLDAQEYVAFDAARDQDIADFEALADTDEMRKIADGLSLARNDADGDGQVSAEEFSAGAADWLAG
ncbi:MAG: hypothetical protein JXJ18_08125, partial [Rhodobacteraceae bacterium]|nr:hypothetical protein [Paracoccaceae bacterium]